MESVPERLVGSSAVVSVDVVTVTYRSEGTVRGALEMLTGHEGVRVIVVDNASDDATLNVLGSLPVETIALDENHGFAHGCNVGAAAGTAPYVLFLNPDARFDLDNLHALVAALEDERRAGVSAPRIVESDGTLDFSLRRFPAFGVDVRAGAVSPPDVSRRATWVDEVIRDPAEYEHAHPVEWVSGACLLVRRSVLEQVGGPRRELLPLWRGRRSLRTDLEGRVRGALRARRRGDARRRRICATARAAPDSCRQPHPLLDQARRPSGRSSCALGVALGAATHAIAARGGWPARRGHLRALAVALTPTSGRA